MRTTTLLLFLSFQMLGFSQSNTDFIPLFDGKTLNGWDYHLVDSTLAIDDVWWVEDGLLKCKGEPMGYLATADEYTHFKLVMEWRWAPGKPAGNSGVLMRITGEPKALPTCYEAQLQHGNVGDIYGFHGNTLSGYPERYIEKESELVGKMSGVKKEKNAEDEAGDWNQCEIYLLNGHLSVYVNGVKVNEADNLEVVSGKIGFQSEGEEIHFRKIEVLTLGH